MFAPNYPVTYMTFQSSIAQMYPLLLTGYYFSKYIELLNYSVTIILSTCMYLIVI